MSCLEKTDFITLPTDYGVFQMRVYRDLDTKEEHFVLQKGDLKNKQPLVRIHSSCVTGDILHSHKCDCGPQLDQAIKTIERAESGLIIYLQQEGRGIGLFNKIRAYKLQEEGLDTVQANVKLGFQPDQRSYQFAAEILKDLDACDIQLLTNNPQKKAGIEEFGITVSSVIPLQVDYNGHNIKYMKTKKDMGHLLDL